MNPSAPTVAPSVLLDKQAFDAACAELDGLLRSMDVPAKRKRDFLWLGRNLGARNSHSPNFIPAMTLIRKLACHERSTLVLAALPSSNSPSGT